MPTIDLPPDDLKGLIGYVEGLNPPYDCYYQGFAGTSNAWCGMQF